MLSQLQSRGFATVSLKPWIKDALRATTMNDAASMTGFRFPPIEGLIVYTETRRLAFRALFHVATESFSELLHSNVIDCNDNKELNAYTEVLKQVRDGDNIKDSFILFRTDNEPFESGQPFSQTFFNLFNYNHDSLNKHVDRSLITVIYSTTPEPDATSTSLNNDNSIQRTSSLWVKDNKGTWHNADRAVTSDEAIIMVGQDFSEMENGKVASSLGVFAAEHAVRVDPMGDRIERSHYRKDPSCTADVGDRLSAAMILRHEFL
jgi:hypothetical protein